MPRWCLGFVWLASQGCASHVVLDDGGSVSYGPSNAGALLEPAELPVHGEGYEIPPTWTRRGLRYGTDELVAMVEEVGRSIHDARPDLVLAVGDLSLRRGGPSQWHRSHESGRDVDLLFFVRDEDGRSVLNQAMQRFSGDGASVPEGGLARRVFDDEANWRLVRTLVESRAARVQYIFIFDDLKQRLLDYASDAGEAPALIAAASELLRQPGDSLPHDDHMHVRILCSVRDRELGCHDGGGLGFRKKGYKYDQTAALVEPAEPAEPAEAAADESE